MAKIYKLHISNFRGIQSFEHVFDTQNFICLIGRGDSGKSTILKAISYVLSPRWNITFLDSDFYEGNINNDIIIEVTLTDIPDSFIQEDKFGFQLRGVNRATGEIHDELQDTHEKALTIRLTINKDLEPDWSIINERVGDNEPIKNRDRGKLKTFLVEDYIDKHFSWNDGTLLNSLFKSIDTEEVTPEKNIIINALRNAKTDIDDNPFGHFDSTIHEIGTITSEFGIELNNTQTTLDFKEIFLKDKKAYLHDGKIPFHLKGKGSRRLISISIQLALVKQGGIILIDEIEQGLEPDRVQHLVNTLKTKNTGQVFITTHSRDVLVELNADNIFLKKSTNSSLFNFNNSLQGVIRKNPEAFFAKKIIVCEGATEIGIIRAFNQYRIQQGKKSLSTLGIRYADGAGNTLAAYAEGFKSAGYDVCLFCDSDDDTINPQKDGLRGLGIKIVDTEDSYSIEKQMFNDLPGPAVTKLIEYAIEDRTEESINGSFNTKYVSLYNSEASANWKITDTPQIRNVLGITSSKKGWFKRIDHGEVIGKIICDALEEMDDQRIKSEFNDLSTWIDA